MCRFSVSATALLVFGALAAAQKPEPVYVKKGTRTESIVATLKANGLPTLEGKWHYIGPFDNTDNRGFDFAYPPEKKVDLNELYRGKRGTEIGWKEFSKFKLGANNNLALFRNNNDSVIYLFQQFESDQDFEWPLSLGSDDTISVWFNGTRLLHENEVRPAAPDQNSATLKVKKGRNELLLKIGNLGGQWEVYVRPELPNVLPAMVRKQFDRDFPGSLSASTSSSNAENGYYRLETVAVPPEIVLEVGGLAFRPDGKLLACTRRGEVWLISYPDVPERTEFKLYASGLHEALGLFVEDNNTVYVVQRPELTKLIDTDGDDKADKFLTICDKWGVSGDYHEFAFGPARDKAGNFYITLNVGFGGGHQAKAPWRGWCVKVTPQGEMTPIATGLRSPNGVNFSPDGDLFYCDNQGEWVASNKMHHIQPGEFYGHQAGLRWLKDSPFAKLLPERVASGMHYDGGPNGKTGMPKLTPPCIWFPYGRMGQSSTEPRWDTTNGKFGPFAGQCFVGDQTTSVVMRVALEKVNGKFQGACFPFRSGLQCGVNRIVFAPDGSMYCGQTNRGWGSRGGKPHGLQRLAFTGETPMEIHTMKVTPAGFDLTFTKPLDVASAKKLAAYSMKSFTYNYWSTYGSPEVDARAEPVLDVTVAADAKSISLTVPGLKVGRVFDLRMDGVRSADGEAVLHPEAYYTLNEIPKGGAGR